MQFLENTNQIFSLLSRNLENKEICYVIVFNYLIEGNQVKT